MPQEYILVIKGRPEGPFTIAQLNDLGIKADDFVKTPTMDDYKQAHEIAELRQLFHFKKAYLLPQYFASFDQRLLASAIDWFIVSGGLILVALLLILFVQDKATRLIISFSLLIAVPIAKNIYNVLMECSVKQATLGKQMLKIKVCDINGEPISLTLSIVRNAFKLLSLLTLFVGYLLAFFNKKQQCLHDILAGTLVIKDRLI